jgi:hypothetical protein
LEDGITTLDMTLDLITTTLHKTTINQTFVIALRAQSSNQKMLESDVLFFHGSNEIMHSLPSQITVP